MRKINSLTTKQTAWFSVETPSVFREYELPIKAAEFSAADRQNYNELAKLADRFQTHIKQTSYRRG